MSVFIKIGLSTCNNKPNTFENLKAMADAGIEVVELCLSGWFSVACLHTQLSKYANINNGVA